MSDINACRESSQESVERIFHLHPAVQFVILKPPPAKTPVWRGWTKTRPPIATVMKALDAGKGIGVVPWTLGRLAAIDVDAGDPWLLEQARPPLCMLMTTRGGHAFYAAGENPPRNKNGRVIKLDGGEITVDIICGATPTTRKYVVLHSATAMAMLARALSSGNEPPPFPHDLLTESPSTRRYNADPVRAHRNWKPRDPEKYIDLTQIWPGGYKGKTQTGRNDALFAVLCRGGQIGRAMFKAGKIKTEADLLVLSVRLNELFPVPMSLAEVERTATQAFHYLPLDCGGIGRDFYTHDPESQRRRQPLAVASRNAKRKADVGAVYELAEQGKKPREIAAKTGVPRTTIQRWLKAPLRAKGKP